MAVRARWYHRGSILPRRAWRSRSAAAICALIASTSPRSWSIAARQAGRLGSLAAAEIISHIGARPQVRLEDLARAKGLLA